MLEAIADAALYAVENVGVPVVVAAVTTLSLNRPWPARIVGRNDRLIGELNEDLRRWVHDRDRAASVEMRGIVQDASAKRVARGGAIPAARGKVYVHVLHEWRDEAHRKLRARDALLDAEGWVHTHYRGRKEQPAAELVLPRDESNIVRAWESHAEENPASAEREPRLQRLLTNADLPSG